MELIPHRSMPHPFGIIAMAKDGTVEHYNTPGVQNGGPVSRTRSWADTSSPPVAPCTNNYMVAQRFESEDELDAIIDYVFTLRMRPTKVKLRMLKSASKPKQYLLVERV